MESHRRLLKISIPQNLNNPNNDFLRLEFIARNHIQPQLGPLMCNGTSKFGEHKNQSEANTKRERRRSETSKIGGFLNARILRDRQGKNDIQKSLRKEGLWHSSKMEHVS